MIDEAPWQRIKAMSELTRCWSWDESVRLPGKEIKQWHSLPIGHGMTHNEIPVKEFKLCYHSHPLLVMHGMRNDETA
jgi:hypothetical protein